jgi:hypothetical protein
MTMLSMMLGFWFCGVLARHALARKRAALMMAGVAA